MLYAFFWVIPRRLEFIRLMAYKLQTPGHYPKESIQQVLYYIITHLVHFYLSSYFSIIFSQFIFHFVFVVSEVIGIKAGLL